MRSTPPLRWMRACCQCLLISLVQIGTACPSERGQGQCVPIASSVWKGPGSCHGGHEERRQERRYQSRHWGADCRLLSASLCPQGELASVSLVFRVFGLFPSIPMFPLSHVCLSFPSFPLFLFLLFLSLVDLSWPFCMSVANSPKTEKNGSRNFIDIAKECAQIPMRHRRCKEDGLRILKEKEINISRTTGRAKITIDLLLQAMAKNGLEDAVASEMIKQLPQEKINIITKWFQERFMGQMEAPSSWKIVKLVFLRKADAEPTKGIRRYRATALTSVMSKWHAACVVLRLENEKEPGSWKSLHVGGIDCISCQRPQVMVTHLLQKHWEWQEDRRPMSAEQPKISSKCMIQQRALAHANVPVTDNEPRSGSHCRNKRCRLLKFSISIERLSRL